MNWLFAMLDNARRLQGLGLDFLGLGPRESEYSIIHSRPGARLRHYSGEASRQDARRMPMLIVPAPIKAPYVWDISPERSVVQQAIKQGFDVHLVEWSQPDEHAAVLGLEDYAVNILGECVEQINQRTRRPKIILMGHSLGGTFAGLYSAYQPNQVAGLVLVEAPLRFGDASGAFVGLLNKQIPAEKVLQESRATPGFALSVLAGSAAPRSFRLERQLDYLWSHRSIRHLHNHWRGTRWMLDELAMPCQLFQDVVELLYRQDCFMRGELQLAGKRLDPKDVVAPLAAIYNPKSEVVPPEAVLDFCREAKSDQKKLIPYYGDCGVALQHLGALTGDNAHSDVWPEVLTWLTSNQEARLQASAHPGAS